MQSVTVLATNGRRQVVKVEPNKTVLWVKIQKFAASLFCLQFHFIILDFGTDL